MTEDSNQAMFQSVLSELQALRSDMLTGQREQRIVVDRMKERYNTDLGQIYTRINDLRVTMTERNSERVGEHRALAQRVSLYSAGVSIIVTGICLTAFSALKDFFFPH